jgi:PTS system nitrogen regulatory IIA component
MQLTVRDVAQLLKTEDTQVYRWIDEGSIPVYTVNEQFRFNRSEVLEWAHTRKLPLSITAFERMNTPLAVPLAGLDGALSQGGVHRGVPGKDRESVLRSVITHFQLPADIDPEFLLQVMLAREKLGSTAVGDGIAIPHVRSPVVLHGVKPAIVLCFLENAIDFSAPDARAVNVLFALLSPNIRTHLHLLARLSTALHDPGFKEAIKSRAPDQRILEEAKRVEDSFPKAAP